MPEQVRCPSCEAVLRVPESLLGASVKCPKCQAAFTANLAPPETYRPKADPIEEPRPRRPAIEEEELRRDPDEEEEDRPRRRRRRRRRFGSVDAESEVAGPAISLMAVSGLSIVLAIVDLIFRIFQFASGGGPVGRPGTSSYAAGQAAGYTAGAILGGGFDLLSVLIAIIIIVGAVKMKSLQAHGLALSACILAIIPMHCCCILGIPFGIWGLVVLNKPEVKDAFS